MNNEERRTEARLMSLARHPSRTAGDDALGTDGVPRPALWESWTISERALWNRGVMDAMRYRDELASQPPRPTSQAPRPTTLTSAEIDSLVLALTTRARMLRLHRSQVAGECDALAVKLLVLRNLEPQRGVWIISE